MGLSRLYTKSGPSVTVTCKANFIKVMKIIKSNDRYLMYDLPEKVGISLSLMHFNLKHILQLQKMSVRWKPPILTDK